jgi:uncharacterized damage-inducible protein DinB
MTTGEILAGLMVRDLRAVQRELEAYPSEASLWVRPDSIPNAGGTLALHLAGNLRHFVGALLGHTGYVRDRDAEFARRDVPRAELLRELDAAIADVSTVLPTLSADRMDAFMTIGHGDRQVQTGEFLTHLAVHLSYHLGQIDYHRRLTSGASSSVDALSLSALASMRSTG